METKELYHGIIELDLGNGDYDIWHIVENGDELHYGTACNAGFISCGFVKIDRVYDFGIDTALEELVDKLENENFKLQA